MIFSMLVLVLITACAAMTIAGLVLIAIGNGPIFLPPVTPRRHAVKTP